MSEQEQADQAPVLVSVAARIATLTINRPQRRNALSREVVRELNAQIIALGQREDVGVIVLTGAGDRAFCAGGDLADQQGGEGALAMHHDRGAFAQLLLTMSESARPLIARVNGHALGGGFGLALSCDLVVASDSASFGMPEVRVGLFPMMIMAVVTRNLPRKLASELMLTGERISAAQAQAMGIVNRVVPPEQLDEAVHALASTLAGLSPAVLQLGRQALHATQDMTLAQALAFLQQSLTINTLSEDAAEGIMAFFGGRAPQWKGR